MRHTSLVRPRVASASITSAAAMPSTSADRSEVAIAAENPRAASATVAPMVPASR